jgi:hypothetical protein
MNKLYKFYITLKYNFYKLYWKIKKPKKPSQGFYGWSEENYNVLDKKAVCYGVLKKF